jgi:hypothetical protein
MSTPVTRSGAVDHASERARRAVCAVGNGQVGLLTRRELGIALAMLRKSRLTVTIWCSSDRGAADGLDGPVEIH